MRRPTRISCEARSTDVGTYYLELPALQDAINLQTKGFYSKGVKYDSPLKEFIAWMEAYLGAEHTALEDAFARLGFLDSYYGKPKVVMGIAAMRYAAWRVNNLWRSWTRFGRRTKD